MSLINDMLQDLDRRGQRQPAAGSDASDERESLLGTGALARPDRWVWLPAALVFVLVSAAVWFWSPWPDAAEREASASQTGNGAEPIEPLTRALGVPEQPEVKPALVVSAEVAPPALERQAQPTARVDTLLAAASRARERDRLTQPAGDNAYDYYQQVLALVPEEPRAQAGLAAIARRYRELAEAAMERDDLEAARRFVQRARSVDPQLAGIGAIAERLQRLTDTTEAEPNRAGAASDGDVQRLEVSLDGASRDRRIARRARERWQAGDRAGARAVLEGALAEWSAAGARGGPVESAAQLAELYLEAGEPARARALVAGADYLPPLEKARQRANIALHEGDRAGAVTHLEAELSSAAADEHYRALLARLYYAEGRHRRAVDSYQALLSDFGQQPAYWLGLGLAQDALERNTPALTAFRRALESGAYARDSSVGRYLERRIAALSRQINAQES